MKLTPLTCAIGLPLIAGIVIGGAFLTPWPMEILLGVWIAITCAIVGLVLRATGEL